MLVRGLDIAQVAPALEGKRPAGEELAGILPEERLAEVLERLWGCGVLEVIDEPV